MKTSALDRFLARNKEKFASHDGLPAEFHRMALFKQAKVGGQAGIVTPHGGKLVGRVVMKFATHCVLNLGGRYGTPGVMDDTNCIFVAGATL